MFFQTSLSNIFSLILSRHETLKETSQKEIPWFSKDHEEIESLEVFPIQEMNVLLQSITARDF